MFYTRLCELLNIKYPIIQGAMGGGASSPELVAAVSNAGGLGVLATWQRTLAQVRSDIRKTRELTDNPFGVNLIPVGQSLMKQAELLVEEGINIVTTGRGDPREPTVGLLKKSKVKVLPVVPTVRHALRLEDEGADAIIASGCEAGGHVGDVSTLPLIPAVVDAVKIPVVAAGGFADGRGLVAALALGAVGIQMGTRFIVTRECPASPKAKDFILKASEENTVVSRIFTGKPVRAIHHPAMDEFLASERQNVSKEHLNTLRMQFFEKTGDPSDPEALYMAAGQISGMIKTIETVREVIENTMRDAELICEKLKTFLLP